MAPVAAADPDAGAATGPTKQPKFGGTVKLKRFWPLAPAALLTASLALSAQPAYAAVGKRLDNDDDSTRSVKMYRSANCYDNPNSVDTRVIGIGHSTFEYSGWSSWRSYRVYVDSSIDVTVWTTDAWVAHITQNVDAGKSVCRHASIDNRRYRIYGYPGIANSTVTRLAPGQVEA